MSTHHGAFQVFVESIRIWHWILEYVVCVYKLDTMRRRDKEGPPPSTASSSAKAKSQPPPAPEPKKFTPEQVSKCREILNKRNYYDILGVKKSATEDDLKRAYRKLSIKVHPDKNSAPQAGDAFKKVSAAYACLTDPEKKRYYDQTGEEPGNNQAPRQNSRFR